MVSVFLSGMVVNVSQKGERGQTVPRLLEVVSKNDNGNAALAIIIERKIISNPQVL